MDDVDLTAISFKCPVWLQTRQLNVLTVLDYFSLSGFYDRSCNNEVVKMQGLDPRMMQEMIGGIEYIVIPVEEPVVYVVVKCRRISSEQDGLTPLARYYILNGIIYQSPTVLSVAQFRMRQALYHIQKAFDSVLDVSDELFHNISKDSS